MDKSKKMIEVTPDDIMRNDGKDGKPLWIVIHDKVYDVTEFNHPGGKEVFKVIDEFDLDKGDEFESVHAPASKKQAEQYLIGELKISEELKKKAKEKKAADAASSNGIFVVFVVFLILVIVVVKGGYLTGGTKSDN